MPNHVFDAIRTRHSLLERLKDWGDQSSWQDFFDTYWRLIYSVALRAGLTDVEAQEVVQETVIAVARKITEFKTDPAHGSFGAWLMRLTRWRIADQFRKRQAGPAIKVLRRAGAALSNDTGTTDPVNLIPDPAGARLETLWTEEWERHLMAVALEKVKRQVSARQFQMFDMHVIQKLTVQDTARNLKVSVASVYMAKGRVARLVGRTLRKLRREMD